MAQNIGLVITLGGVEKVISSIEELEGAINSAREQLRKTTIPGSAEFKTLANEIRIADSKLKDLKKSSEGLEFEQKLEGFAKLGGSITAGFAAATAAVNLFGGDTEKVSQAAAQAQNVLTIALTARSAAEGVAGLRTVALTVKTLAQTAATAAANSVTKAFYTTLAANPMGAVLAVIGLVVTALVAFTSNTQEAADSQDEFQASLDRTNAELDFQYQLLQRQGATEVQLAERRLRDELEREQLFADNFAKETTRNRFSEETAKARAELAAQQDKVALAREDVRVAKEKETEEVRKKNAETGKKRAEERKAQIEAEIALQGELTRAELARELAGTELDPIELNKKLKERLDLIQGLVDGYTSEETALERYNKVLGSTYELKNQDYALSSKVQEQLILLGKAAGFYRKEGEELVYVTETMTSSMNNLGEQFQETYIDSIVIKDGFGNMNTIAGEQLVPGLQQVYNTLTLVSSALREANTDLTGIELVNLLKPLQDFEDGEAVTINSVIRARQGLANFQKQYVDDYVKANLKLKEGEVGYQKALEESTKSGEAAFQLLLENTKNFVAFERATFKAAESTTQLTEKIVKLQQSAPLLNAFLAQNRDLINESFSVDLSKLGENRNALLALDNLLATKRFDQAEGFRDELIELETQLAQQGIDITKASDEEKLKLLREFLAKEVEATESAEEKKRTSFQKTIQDIEKYIQDFQSVLNSLSQVVSEYYSLQLQELELQNKAILDQVVGDTEVANKKRLEQQEIYEKQREELEKEAAKRTLQIQLAQAVANTAQAITRVFAQDGTIGFITAGLVAAANAIQIGLITQQLGLVSSYARGGFIKGQGGLVVGPSHEQGGVKFAQGGIELEGGEAVINRQSSLQYGALLNSVNMAGGGKPLVVNNAFDDSRLLEALAKQKSEPIRAYVLEGDITQKQNVTRRLEQLSQF